MPLIFIMPLFMPLFMFIFPLVPTVAFIFIMAGLGMELPGIAVPVVPIILVFVFPLL